MVIAALSLYSIIIGKKGAAAAAAAGAGAGLTYYPVIGSMVVYMVIGTVS